MKTIHKAIAVTIGAFALTGCATPAYVSPVEVTRFTGDAPAMLGQGTINIQPAASLDPQSIEYAVYEAQLAQELASLGYDVVQGEASQTAILGIDIAVSEHQRRGPVSVGAGGSTGSYGSGVGVGVGIDLSSLTSQPTEEIARQISVSIRPANDASNLWEGRARFTATGNSDFADPASAAQRAIGALFNDFPGTSGETIEVE